MKQCRVIYADPPWMYDDRAQAGERGVGFKYPTMTDRQIKNLQVGRIAAGDCVLFLWATAPRMPLAFEVMKAWGFQYKTIAFTWVKTPKGKPPTIAIDCADVMKLAGDAKKANIPLLDYIKFNWGMGNWTRANSEFVLLGVRGNPKRVDAGVHSVVLSERRKHSEKPPEVRDRIVKLMGDVPRVELFARVVPIGWDAIGSAIDGQDIVKVISGGAEELSSCFAGVQVVESSGNEGMLKMQERKAT